MLRISLEAGVINGSKWSEFRQTALSRTTNMLVGYVTKIHDQKPAVDDARVPSRGIQKSLLAFKSDARLFL